MSPRLAALALAAAALAFAAPPPAAAQELGPPVIKATTPCAVGQAIAAYWMQRDEGGARRIFDDQPVTSGTSNVGVPADISPRLFDKWRSAPAVSLLGACPDTRKAVEAFGPFATPDDRLRASGVQHGPYLVRIGAPVANRTDLIIAVHSHCASLCGYGGVLHYRKTAQGWVRMAPLAIVLS